MVKVKAERDMDLSFLHDVKSYFTPICAEYSLFFQMVAERRHRAYCGRFMDFCHARKDSMYAIVCRSVALRMGRLVCNFVIGSYITL